MKYLRQALWQLQEAVEDKKVVHSVRLFEVEPRWISVSPVPDLWLDVTVFEESISALGRTRAMDLNAEDARRLKDAVDLYRGGLLAGWYQDWCLYERERLEDMYLGALYKLVSYSEASREYEAGLAYGNLVLRCDRAHELTHRGMMRLFYLAGDRTSALRQYERCVDALRDDLGVKPSQETVALFLQIKRDYLSIGARDTARTVSLPEGTSVSVELVGRLEELEGKLSDLQQLQQRVQDDIRAIRWLSVGKE